MSNNDELFARNTPKTGQETIAIERKKKINIKWCHIFNNVCLKDGIFPKYTKNNFFNSIGNPTVI